VTTFGGANPHSMYIKMASTVIQWVNKFKYLSLYFCSTYGNLDVSNNVHKFYGQYHNIRTVLGYGTREMNVVHLCKVYCLSALMYGCGSWHLQNKEQNRISVAWNNSFRSIFNCCWQESVNPLQYFCKVLPINYLIHERKLLHWNKLFISDNSCCFLYHDW